MATTPIEEVLAFVRHIAQMEAVRLSHEYIDAAHVLLSLVQTRHCEAHAILMKMKAYPSHVYVEVERRFPPGPPFEPSGVQRPLSLEVRDLVVKLPERMRLEFQRYDVTVAILLVLLEQQGTIAQSVLASFGVTKEKLLEFLP